MSQTQPFDFSDFAATPAPKTTPDAPSVSPPTSVSADDVARARLAGYAEGVEAALKECAAQESAALASIATRFGEQTAEFDAIIAGERRALKSAAAAFLKEFATRIATDREIEIVLDLMRRLLAASADRAPAALYLNPASRKRVGDRLERELAAQGAASLIKIESDPSLNAGECRLQWRGGSASRYLRQAIEEIDAMIERANPRAANEATVDATPPKETDR